MSVPAGPPIDPGRHEVRYTGMVIVFSPTTNPSKILDKICVDTLKLVAPKKAAKMVR